MKTLQRRKKCDASPLHMGAARSGFWAKAHRGWDSRAVTIHLCWIIAFAPSCSPSAFAQQRTDPGPSSNVSAIAAPAVPTPDKGAIPAAAPAPVGQLVSEALQHNPQILAARRGWQAAELVPTQVATLPSPELLLQQLNVGNPRPFAGFTTSNFAYTGFGISQDLPYPGKLRLKGERARREAAAVGANYEAERRKVVAQLKSTYFRLAYVEQSLRTTAHDRQIMEQIEKIASARYGVGKGNQQDVLKAQFEATRLIQQQQADRGEEQQLEAQIKEILGRPPDAPDITPQPLTLTTLPYSSDELLNRVRAANPGVAAEKALVQSQSLQVELARKDFYPDFSIQYMWQQTGPQFPNYYMLTFGVRLPIYRRRKQRPELAEAVENLNRSRHEYEARVQQTYFLVRDQYVAAHTDEQLLKTYREGLIPQAAATFNAGLAAYGSGLEDFQTLLSSFQDVLNLDIEYWRTLAAHESALARLEELTGMPLR